ncbi:hypothetical protein [Methylobacter tundripaludum]|uniref:hypothetical protein n=1 Tax=Methylobacter tundripaludum TaxID=173365 RepID=UPI0004DF0982|nr:hypothetical protein [Methylobacter tundripaludum]
MLKYIAHFFSKRCLDAHQRDTQAAITRYELEKEQSEFRINERHAELKESLEQRAKTRNEELEETINYFNQFFTEAEAIRPLTQILYKHVFNALDIWLELDIQNQEINHQKSCINALEAELEFYTESIEAYKVLAQTDEREQWKLITQSVPLNINSLHIDRAINDVKKWTDSQASEYDRQLKRIESSKKFVISQIGKLHHLMRETIKNCRTLNDALTKERNEAKQLFKEILTVWQSVKSRIDKYYPESFDELKEIRQAQFEQKNNLFNSKDSLDIHITYYQKKIDDAYNNYEFDAIDNDKYNKQRYLAEKKALQRQIGELLGNMNETKSKVDTLIKMQKWLSQLHPAHQVENIYRLLNENYETTGEKMYWKTLGVITNNIKPDNYRVHREQVRPQVEKV